VEEEESRYGIYLRNFTDEIEVKTEATFKRQGFRFQSQMSNSTSQKEELPKTSVDGETVLEEGDALDTSDFETLAAADVLAHHHVVAAEHIGLRLGKLGAIAIVGTGREIFLFSADEPLDFVFGGLTAVRAKKAGRFLIGAFVEEFAFIHGPGPRRRSLVSNIERSAK
jgi:hypothetical protein